MASNALAPSPPPDPAAGPLYAEESAVGASARMGWAALIIFFVLFLGFSAFFRMDAAVSAEGVVKVSGERQTVQHRTGGTITALHVREGQNVQAGQVLIELAGAEVAANEQSLAAQVVGLMAERARLQAEIDEQPALTPPAEFTHLPLEDQPLAAQALQRESRLLDSERRALHAQQAVVAQQAAQLSEKVSGLDHQMASSQQQDTSYDQQLSGMRELAAQGYASLNRVRELERARQATQGDYARLNADRASTRNQIGEMRFRSLSLATDQRRQASEDLRKTVDDLNAVSPRWLDAREQVEHTLIRAPVGGQVVGLSVFTVGGVIAPGDKLMSIVPANARLVVEAHINPIDADELTLGQAAELKFPAFHDRNAPVVRGTVTRISADAFVDDKQNTRYYTAEITVPASDLAKLRAFRPGGSGLKPGLPATVLVPLRRRTLLAYLVEPLNQALWRSGHEH